MPPIYSFAPVAGSHPRALILGTMPGVASLRAGEYYGHPRNQFWPLMGSLFRFDPALPYQLKLQALRDRELALWDVVAECERQGSLDSDIEKEKPNLIREFLALHNGIKTIFFNGGPAHRLFRRHFPDIAGSSGYTMVVLPSTSPACARYSFEEKLRRWHEVLLSILP